MLDTLLICSNAVNFFTQKCTIMSMPLVIGAEEADFDSESGLVEFLCGVHDFPDVMSAAEEKNFDVISAKVAYIPKQYVDITTARETEAFNTLIENLEKCDNTTAVHHNVDETAV